MEKLTLSSIHLYPLKSCAALSVPKAQLLPAGLAGDRRWMLVDETGKFLTQRDYPAMATIRALPNLLGLTLSAPGRSPCDVSFPSPGALRVPVSVWQSVLELPVANDQVNAWCSRTMNRPVRLVYLDDDCLRAVDARYAQPGDTVSLADGFAVLIATSASLAALNAHLPEPVPMDRFRPNLVIDGAQPWGEDSWRRIRIGDVELELVKPCARCKITQVDQQTGMATSQEPIRTLRQLRFAPHYSGVLFGVNATPRCTGWLEVGQPVEILETRIPPELRQKEA